MHTSGPWRHTRFTGNKSWTVQHDATHEALANVRTGEGDARLIAAAPDLLAALKKLTAGMRDDQDSLPRVRAEEVRAARAAIAKAEGR